MRKLYKALLVTICLVACQPIGLAVLAERVIASCQADLDSDGATETVAITCRTWEHGHPMGGEVRVLRKGNLIWRQERMNPWKVRLADVDGDKRKDIIVGVWKKSPKDPVMAKRAFVYGWNGTRMLPKWLGSRLSRRFIDFDVRDINRDGLAELMALEVAPNQPRRVSIYRWKSFGFEWLGCMNARRWKELTK